MLQRDRALVIVPTYNERDSVARVIARLLDAVGDDADVLVVDDSSPDGTANVVQGLADREPRVNLLKREEKRGLGTAYLDGFEWALQRGYGAVVEMDADGSHDPADVPRLLAALEDADLVVGSRYIESGRIENWPALRRVLSRAGNLYARLLLGIDVADMTSGFRAYRSDWLARADLDKVRSEGYGFQIEMARRVVRSSGTIVEIPITFSERPHGRSKMSRAIVFEALWWVTRWGLRDRFTARALSGGSSQHAQRESRFTRKRLPR